MNVGLALVLMAAAWTAVTGSWSAPNLALGLFLAAAALFVVRREIGSRSVTIRPVKLLLLACLFAKEIVLSACRVAILVLSPRMHLQPGIFAFPLKAERDFEITLLANLITLTPGTLSVDVSDDRSILYVHALDVSDPDRTRAEIAAGFERRILEAFR